MYPQKLGAEVKSFKTLGLQIGWGCDEEEFGIWNNIYVSSCWFQWMYTE